MIRRVKDKIGDNAELHQASRNKGAVTSLNRLYALLLAQVNSLNGDIAQINAKIGQIERRLDDLENPPA